MRLLDALRRADVKLAEPWEKLFQSRADLIVKLNAVRLHPRESGPIKFLEIAQFLFSHRTRELVCEPVIEELREDYILAAKRCRTPRALAWARFCFGFRALVAFLGCFRISCGSALGRFIPSAVKHWWTMFR